MIHYKIKCFVMSFCKYNCWSKQNYCCNNIRWKFK